MAYSELIKNFENIREYMRHFYVYGFGKRNDYNAKSRRSYDNERRRIESWLGEYVGFHNDENGKSVFISVDSRAVKHNPLYNAFKAKSFTDIDINLHFFILDILADGELHTVKQITEKVAEYLYQFEDAPTYDESTIRKKLKEYAGFGIIRSENVGRELAFQKSEDICLEDFEDAVNFFSEENPLGVIGSFLLDKMESNSIFSFKHHYMFGVVDSQILYELGRASQEKRAVEINIIGRKSGGTPTTHKVFPVKVYLSTQGGRQYLLGWNYRFEKLIFYRISTIKSVKVLEQDDDYLKYYEKYGNFKRSVWGVSDQKHKSDVTMDIHVEDNERYIVSRLFREKRNGRVEKLDDHTYRFSIKRIDSAEVKPWRRTYIGRIVRFECTDKEIEQRFYDDINTLEEMYGVGEDDV